MNFGIVDTITYYTMIMAVMRRGYAIIPISPRNSPAAVAHLIKTVCVNAFLWEESNRCRI